MLHQKNILIIDNFDSFTFNIAQMIGEVNGQEAIVLPNTVSWREIHKIPHDRIILSPGPGTPYQRRDVGSSMDILSYAEVPVLGVCLGHQCLTLHHGGRVIAAPEPMHGRIRRVHHYGTPLFRGIPETFDVTRYHSLVADSALPNELELIAETEDGIVMALRHRTLPHWGVQFHPESICSEYGREIFSNFLSDAIASPQPPTTIQHKDGLNV